MLDRVDFGKFISKQQLHLQNLDEVLSCQLVSKFCGKEFYFFTEPVLRITPKYFLKVPTDSYANFQCKCDKKNTVPCEDNKMSWTFVDRHTGVKTDIYKNGVVVGSKDTYFVNSGVGYTNFTIEGRLFFIPFNTF